MVQVPKPSVAEKSADDDGKPKFGRLLMVLIFTVFLISVITWASEAYWS